MLRRAKTAMRPQPSPVALTMRQVDVLRLVAAGLTNKQVAAELDISVHTVESHLHSIYHKLKLTSRGAATRFAMEHGIV
jgi:DNA-binding NarL/FixJ family response regulator